MPPDRLPDPAPAWVHRVARAVRPLLPPGFVGSLELYVGPDGITTIHVRQSFRGPWHGRPDAAGDRDGRGARGPGAPGTHP